MNARLYHNDPYLQKFSSEVLKETAVNGKPAVVLKQTAFYPASGGQPHDTGTLNNVPVVEVKEDQSHQIIHLLETPLKTSQVEGRINWQRRFDHMQQHTGQHILSQAFMRTVEAKTIAFHLGEEGATIDLDRSGFSIETFTQVENLANQIIYENRKVMDHFVNENELDRFPVRTRPTVGENIRIIEIKDFDYSPCGGTHCSRTGEIGILKIKRYEKYKGGTRVHFVCGFRALNDYQNKSEILKQLSASMSSGETDLHKNTQKIQADLKHLQRQQTHLKKQLIKYESSALLSERIKVGEIHIIKKIFDGRNQRELKILAKTVLENVSNTVILFGSQAEGKASLFFCCSEELDFNMGSLMETACRIIDGRGGGQQQQAQGGGPNVEKLETALQVVEETLSITLSI